MSGPLDHCLLWLYSSSSYIVPIYYSMKIRYIHTTYYKASALWKGGAVKKSINWIERMNKHASIWLHQNLKGEFQIHMKNVSNAMILKILSMKFLIYSIKVSNRLLLRSPSCNTTLMRPLEKLAIMKCGTHITSDQPTLSRKMAPWPKLPYKYATIAPWCILV